MLKVIHVINTRSGGGAENIVSSWPSNYSGVAIKKYFIFETKYTNKYLAIFLTIIKLRSRIKCEKISIVHTHLNIGFYCGFLIKLLCNVKWIHTEHNTKNNRQNIYLLRFLDKIFYKNCDLIVAISKGCKEYFHSVYGDVPRVEIINNGADHYPIIKQAYEKSELKLVSIGSLTEQKGFEAMIEIVRHISSEHISSYRVYGEGPKFSECINAIGDDSRIELMGWTDNIASVLHETDILIVPSRWEGFGLVVVEALSAGIPVIASNVPGLNMFATHDDTSVTLFEVGDYKSFLEALVSCKNNLDQNFEQVVYNARKLANKYSKIDMIKNYHSYYYKIVSQKYAD